MRCKKGDLAVIVGHIFPENSTYLGKIVRCLEFQNGPFGPGWRIGVEKYCPCCFLDKHLRPIRDNPGQDETLTWAPVPVELKTPKPHAPKVKA